jgi:CheY-like chemotaxis protein
MNTILLIEDNLEIRENTAEILELANYKVVTAENGKDGIEKAASVKPDVIICDIMMPVLDGYGVLHMLNKNEELRDIPFIFLTAKTERLDFRKGMEMGADDYITKPFTELELLNAIEQRLKKIDVYKKRFSNSDEGMKNLLQDIGRQDVWNEFASDRNINHYKRKSVIYSEGNHPNRLFYVKKGKVKLYKSNEDGKDLTVGLFGEGDYFGYLSLLENSVYHETAEAMEDSEIAMIPREEFDALVREMIPAHCSFSINFVAHAYLFETPFISGSECFTGDPCGAFGWCSQSGTSRYGGAFGTLTRGDRAR